MNLAVYVFLFVTDAAAMAAQDCRLTTPVCSGEIQSMQEAPCATADTAYVFEYKCNTVPCDGSWTWTGSCFAAWNNPTCGKFNKRFTNVFVGDLWFQCLDYYYVCTSGTNADGDGHYSTASCLEPHDDCNDNDKDVYPGAPELCDNKDNDCDPKTPDICCYDNDKDGHSGLSWSCPMGDDCNDYNEAVKPRRLKVGKCTSASDSCQTKCVDYNDYLVCDDGNHYCERRCLTLCDKSEFAYTCTGEMELSEAADFPIAIVNSCSPIFGCGKIIIDAVYEYEMPCNDQVCQNNDDDEYYAISPFCKVGKDCDDGDPASYPGAPEICSGKDNNCNGEQDGFIISVVPPSVAPLMPGDETKQIGNTKADIVIKPVASAPTISYDINMGIMPDPKSGGHGHHDATRPHGTFSANGKDAIGVWYGRDLAEKKVAYRSSEVSGTDKIMIRMSSGGAAQNCETKIDVQVPGLASLEFGDYDLKCFVMDCGSYKHSDHYRVKPWVKTGFGNIAAAYKAAFPNDHILIVNDGSLPWGGLYDYKDTWQPPHKTHRVGTDIDVRSKNIPAENRKDFKKIVCTNGGYPKLEYPGEENEHYHLYFMPYIPDHYKLCNKNENFK